MGKTTVWILGDQLLESHPALQKADDQSRQDEIVVLIIESRAKLQRREFHRKKIVLLLSAMRHFAHRLEQSGWQVDYQQAENFMAGLKQHLATQGPNSILAMESASYPGRKFQKDLTASQSIPLTLIPNTQFLTGAYNPIPDPIPNRQYRMEHFYRNMRRHFEVLMEGDQPIGGQWNFDRENRKRLPKDIPIPEVPIFPPDDITSQVIREIIHMDTGWGSVDGFGYAVTRKEAKGALQTFLQNRLWAFGPYEDAMTEHSSTIFHSQLSPYLNLGLLEPMECIQAAESMLGKDDVSLPSVEGFIRQILGWREFMYWQYWRQMPGMLKKNAWNAKRAVPSFFWNAETSMHCLSVVLQRVFQTGYAHHIERLMILSNFLMLVGVNPRRANDWFLDAFIDAYDWVMPPNVIGMGLNADGGLTATKPYISSANYIQRMSDYCSSCSFDPKKRVGSGACPFNSLYWNFHIEHEERLRENPRMSRSVFNLDRMSPKEKQSIRTQASFYIESGFQASP